jgi:hypothetical protein
LTKGFCVRLDCKRSNRHCPQDVRSLS